MLMVDRCCRIQLLKDDPDLKTILSLCQSHGDASLRVVASKLLLSLVQRDSEIRMRLAESEALEIVLEILKERKDEIPMIPFCMASILSTFVLDEAFMETIQKRNRCYKMFQISLSLLKSGMERATNEEMQPNETAEESIERDGLILIRTCEGYAQSAWGAAYFCVLHDPHAINLEEIKDIAKTATLSAFTSHVDPFKKMFLMVF